MHLGFFFFSFFFISSPLHSGPRFPLILKASLSPTKLTRKQQKSRSAKRSFRQPAGSLGNFSLLPLWPTSNEYTCSSSPRGADTKVPWWKNHQPLFAHLQDTFLLILNHRLRLVQWKLRGSDFLLLPRQKSELNKQRLAAECIYL